ncbi:class I SAM-dependent methyltransferase [Marinicella litoralis]|uniref:Putative methyltransferase n=1 Tax=Marinicella litoralis TaxID=644220 RepID=A0A4V3DHT3_9GAMM|nr:class I SAM-dependent methyltransferase [Marinicella litoralis]TDR19451.1 putative methyltransferase [Marinicella litoralis]
MYKSWILISLILILSPVQAHKPENHASDIITQALSAPDRSEADRQRDTRSRPDVTLALLNIGHGDVVFDVFGGGGYYSELIARVVGEGGKVYLHNNQAYRNFVNDALSQRMSQNNMTQMIQHDREVDDLGIQENTLNAALIIMSYHDLFYDDKVNNWPQIDHNNFIQQIHRGLKPGGRFLIVDHQANSARQAQDTHSLHRIEKDFAIDQMEALGFKRVAESVALANPDDDKSQSVFDPEVRGKTDRFIVVFEKLTDKK